MGTVSSFIRKSKTYLAKLPHECKDLKSLIIENVDCRMNIKAAVHIFECI